MHSTHLMSIITLDDIINGLLNAVNGISILVGDLDRELFLNGHDNFDCIQTVQTKILDKVGLGCHLMAIIASVHDDRPLPSLPS